MQTVLGSEEFLNGFTLQGCPSAPEVVAILHEVIAAVGMTPYGDPDVKHFPTAEGKGGVGCQVYQILTESWIVGGTWPELNKSRIVISSCKPYDPKVVENLLIKRIGPLIPGFGGGFPL